MAPSQPLATDPGRSASPPVPRGASSGRLVLTHGDLLWFKTSQDEEGRITLELLECSREHIGVLVDDNGESLGLLLTRSEAGPAPDTRRLADRIDPEDVVMTESARSIPREDVRELTGAACR
jgi:hypothetical protein